MESESIQTIIQGGGVGIAVLMILKDAWKDKMYNKTVSNHMAHTSEILNELSVVIKNNSRILERIERILDKND